MRRLRAIRIGMLVCLTAVALCALLSGCMTASMGEQSDQEVLPWSEPAGWERTTIGIPF